MPLVCTAATDNTTAAVSREPSEVAQLDKQVEPAQEQPVSFESLGVDQDIVAALAEQGIHRPSPIQAAAIPAALSGANCAIQSYTGSGKTLSYLLPVLTLALQRAEALAADPSTPRRGGLPDVPIQALVVCPSQELAMQVLRVGKSLLPPEARRYAVQQVIGGANPKRQAEALDEVPGPLLVVGTPGRLAEMVRTTALKLHRCPIMVLDEADQLLATAFLEDINHLSEHCGKRAQTLKQPQRAAGAPPSPAAPRPASQQRQTLLVSATMTPSIMAKAAKWCPAPKFVAATPITPRAPAAQAAPATAAAPAAAARAPEWGWGVRGWDGPASPLGPKTRGGAGGVAGDSPDELPLSMPPSLLHYYIVAEPRHKVDTLRRAIHALSVERCLVFMNFQQRLKDTQFKLQARGMEAAALHGDLPKMARTNLMNDFRRGRMRALVVSDVAARGLDIPQCDAVFQLELPSGPQHYAHRAGRTGRLGSERDGTVVSIVSPGERFVMEKMQAQLGMPILEAHVAHGKFALGPPPGGYTFDKDREKDEAREGDEGGKGQAKKRQKEAGGKGTQEGQEAVQARIGSAGASGRDDDARGGRRTLFREEEEDNEEEDEDEEQLASRRASSSRDKGASRQPLFGSGRTMASSDAADSGRAEGPRGASPGTPVRQAREQQQQQRGQQRRQQLENDSDDDDGATRSTGGANYDSDDEDYNGKDSDDEDISEEMLEAFSRLTRAQVRMLRPDAADRGASASSSSSSQRGASSTNSSRARPAARAAGGRAAPSRAASRASDSGSGKLLSEVAASELHQELEELAAERARLKELRNAAAAGERSGRGGGRGRAPKEGGDDGVDVDAAKWDST